MAKRGDRVFVDTNVIIEAHRTNVWKWLVKSYSVKTVETCFKETQQGGEWLPGYVSVPKESLLGCVEILKVTALQRVKFALVPGADCLDPGEQDLLACLLADKGLWVVSDPDKAALRVLHTAGLLDRAVALEELVEGSGMKPKFRENYTRRWQGKVCLLLRMGVG